MQIMGTQLTRSTAPTGEPIVRLVFQGEGGERIAVDMASNGRDGDREADVIERARVMLVQTAAFGVEHVRSGTVRTGSGGRGASISSDGENFLFEYREGDGSRHAPARLPGVDAARDEALRSAVDLLDEDDARLRTGWLIRVYDEAGAMVCSIDAGEAIAERERVQKATDL